MEHILIIFGTKICEWTNKHTHTHIERPLMLRYFLYGILLIAYILHIKSIRHYHAIHTHTRTKGSGCFQKLYSLNWFQFPLLWRHNKIVSIFILFAWFVLLNQIIIGSSVIHLSTAMQNVRSSTCTMYSCHCG